ncbi:CLUMA_CG014487, isoform A [Clunio marinus]|uniref:Transcription termination factor 3, mitochondrial n=1 Tax=Clunio marinus TaxID=568069 RepID=A0A1J1INL0_9DIPT|nr:CLUMA_CG014487, isoform A [Clunio marinus]
MNFSRIISVTKLLKGTRNQCLTNTKGFCSSVTVNPVNSIEKISDASESFPETVDDLPTYFSPTFNFAAYINKSETLRKFVELGVDLSKLEKKKGIAQFILKLDFDKNVKDYLILLHDLGLPPECYGYMLTKNPLILKESISDLETRIFYLRSKKFSLEQVQEIVGKNPYWLSFSTRRIDRRLGWFQKNFKLTSNDLRFLVTKQPRLITYNLEHIRENSFCIKEEMGFDGDEVKILLLSCPRLWMNNRETIFDRFDYIHNWMDISHDRILQSPEILTNRLSRLKQRFQFLKLLGKAQFDETKPGYISFKMFLEGSDEDFVLKVCKSSLERYDNFLKTL